MSPAPHRVGANQLGDGFVLEEDATGGDSVIVATPLQSAGVVAIMSTAPTNVRSDLELSRWAERTGVPNGCEISHVHQVHGSDIIRTPPARSDVEADGLWCEEPGAALAVRIADCAAIWMADVASGRFALLHAGWKGVAAHIVPNALKLLSDAGSDIAQMLVGIGPHLQACCFEVGPEVAQRFSAWQQAILPATRLHIAPKRNDSFSLDLAAVVCRQLSESGVLEENVFASTACTRCSSELFHSYRRNGAGGPLMAALARRAA